VLFIAAPHPVFILASTFRHFSDDDARASREILVTGGLEKNGLADLKLVYRHGTPLRKQPTF
jgi:hypothetical protein